ncbi:MAG: metallophosphoesterase [Salinivirgaceae bacterium]|nr:metallophosphoesterase [Salinivirgaceae bacterium]MDD4747527.1 metallophosphoesterase [Salinivirgaceae bacterium]
MRLYVSSIIIIAFIVIIDWWFVRYVSRYKGRRARILYWFSIVSSAAYISFFTSIFLASPLTADVSGANFYDYFFWAITWNMIWYFPRFVLMVLTFLAFLSGLISTKFKTKVFRPFNNVFIIIVISLGLYGFFIGRSLLIERSFTVENKQLPASFNNYRIVQLSDMHLGTMANSKDRWLRFVDKINKLNPDLIVFTGDLVNNFWTETLGWDSVFSRLHANDGKIAIMGNHDYGDYIPWTTQYDKVMNHTKVKSFLTKNGFQILENENVSFIKNNDTLIIAGVENWGHPPFPKYGNLSKALQETGNLPIVLLTHDPDHWEGEVLDVNQNIFLTLTGHTHGFQVGMRTKWLTFSPAAWRYKYWGGMYQVGDKNLYVNTGAGFIAFKGRIGMWPEVAIFDLKATSTN